MRKFRLVVINNPGLDGSAVNMRWKSGFSYSIFNFRQQSHPIHPLYRSYTNVKAVHVNLGLKYPG